MMKVIVSASSAADDLVIDAFCGSGTTLHAAATLGRRYVGCDASLVVAKATIRRMRYGVQAMGDCVTNKRGKNLELPVGSPPDIGCKLVTTREVIENYGAEVRRVAAV